ncbi:MAG: circularly permuted type 2 ATP-grasp protein [Rhizobacter sp.]|nr:circularly permuted type 2 ATP-grasp protein [Rhizobacter sp.]
MPQRLLRNYAVPSDRFDEMLAAPGAPRPHWGAFLRALAARREAEVGDALAAMEREIRDSGITYNVYADPEGADRPWQVDPLPLLIAPAEWAQIEAGIAQRAELLNRVLADLYGAQTLLSSGAVPPSVVFGHSGFLHQAQGIRPPGGVHLFHYAADLARSPDGHWWVFDDRTQAPSGAGYALENRLIVSRVFPRLFRDLRVQHMASFFDAFRESLHQWAPRGDGEPLVALLTPGPYNETYFEHALLARYLGFALVEGGDLTVRDGKLWLKTVEGLKRVHALLRRQDDAYCDPLELRSDSALGVAGLTDCARRGTVMLANALGAGVLESGALLGYLPQLAERLLGEPLKLPSVATWWLGEPAAFDDAWERLDRLIIKPLDRASGMRALFGADLSAAERDALRARVALHPQRYVAQEWVRLSQAPVLDRERSGPRGAPRDRLSARTVGLRVFAVATPGGYRVLPGGLTRVASESDARIIAMQRGGRSKDSWVLSDAPVNASFSLLSSRVKPEELGLSRAGVSSRAAENLFWFGRYGERCDATARLLRVAIASVIGDDARSGDGDAPAVVLARRLLLLPESDPAAPALLQAATQPDTGLGANLQQLARVADTLRDRMSGDNWRALNHLSADPIFRRGLSSPAQLPLALAWLDRAVMTMTTLSGFVLDGMTRGIGWRFLSIGRRVERLTQLCAALDVAMHEGRTGGLDWLLELTDSAMSYRASYPVAPEWMPVLDLVVRDATNPRAIAFQLKGLLEYVDKLEQLYGRFASDVLAPARDALDGLTPADLHPESAALSALVAQLAEVARQVSDELTLKFFSHASSRSVLSLVA